MMYWGTQEFKKGRTKFIITLIRAVSPEMYLAFTVFYALMSGEFLSHSKMGAKKINFLLVSMHW